MGSPWWPTFTLLWVCLQGAFGSLTVTMKLFPAIVTLHVSGGLVLVALLCVPIFVTDRRISRLEGALFVTAYAVYLGTLIFVRA